MFLWSLQTIDHLEIESSTVLAESMDGKEQVAKYGIPAPEDGKFAFTNLPFI